MIQLESLCSTGEAGSSLTYVHMTYPQTCFFSIHEKKKTSSEYTEYACMRDSSTAPGQACLSLFGDLCRQTLPPSKYIHVSRARRWTHASATLRQSHAADRAFDFAKGIYKCRVGVSRKFRACAYVRCAPVRPTVPTDDTYNSCQSYDKVGSLPLANHTFQTHAT